MKKSIIVILFALYACVSFGEEFGQLCIASFVPITDNISESPRNLLENRLGSIISDAGYVNNWNSQRFVITAKLDNVSRTIIPGNPVRISQDFEVKIIIGDIVTNEIFASHVVKCHGMGKTEEQSQIQAFQRITSGNEEMNSFVEKAVNRINDYYRVNCPNIIKEAESLSSRQKYDEAIFLLLSVPAGCGSCYSNVQDCVVSIYQQALDMEGKKYVQEARNVWYSNQDYVSATQALEILSKVNVYSHAQDDATKLAQSINDKLRDDEKREYEFRLKMYNDSVDNVRLRQERSHETTMAFMEVLNVFARKPRLAPLISKKRSIF